MSDKFRITTNGLWFRIEYYFSNFYHGGQWDNVCKAECFENIPSKFNTLEEARKVLSFLQDGGDPYDWHEVK